MGEASRDPIVLVTDLDRLPSLRCTHAVVMVDPGAPAPRIALPPERVLILRARDAEDGAGAPGEDEARALLGLCGALPPDAVIAFASPAGTTRAPTAAYVALCAGMPPERAMLRARAAAPGFLPNAALASAADRLLGSAGRIAALADAQVDDAMAAAAGPPADAL